MEGEGSYGFRYGWSLIPTKGTSPLARGGHSCCYCDNKFYVFGGSRYNPSKEKELLVQDDLHSLDLSTSQWTRVRAKGPSPSPRYAHTATAVGKKIVIFGGFNGKTYLEDVNILDTGKFGVVTFKNKEKGTWHDVSIKGTPPQARYAHSASLIGNLVLIFGGCGSSNVFNDLRILELGPSISWLDPPRTQGSLPPPRAYHTATILPKQRLYVFGGRAGNRYYNDLHMLALDTMTWTKVQTQGNVPSPRAYHISATFDSNKILIFGGMDGTRCFNDIYILDTSINLLPQLIKDTMYWKQETLANPPSPRHKHDGVMISSSQGSQFWIFGGMDAPPASFNDTFVLSLGFRDNDPKDGRKSQTEVTRLKEELDLCYHKIDYLSGKHLDRLSLVEIEDLEKLYFEGLQKISIAKVKGQVVSLTKQKEKIINACRLEFRKPEDKKRDLNDRNPSELKDVAEKLQESVTQLQSENLKLRRKMRDHGVDLMEGVQRGSVTFSNVNTREFLPQQGIAPLGMDMISVRENSEPLHLYEKRREVQRKGVVRIPEEERIQILKSQGISDDSLNDEAKDLERLNWNRLQSISSPTENPLPEEQREMYRRILLP